MYKLPLSLIGLLLLLVTNVFAQSGSFTVTTPCNSYNRGELIWIFTWAKQTSPHPGIKLSYSIHPGNTFKLGSRIFTRSEVGFADSDIKVMSITAPFSFDVYYEGDKVGTVGTGKYISFPGSWLLIEGDYTLFVNGVSSETAKATFLSNIEVKNFRFQESVGLNIQFSDNLLAKLKQQEEAGKPQNSDQQKKEEQKSSNSQSQSPGTGTGSSGSNSNNNNYGQQVYNQTLENNKQIQQNTANANQAITDATTAIWGTAEERKAEREKKEQKEIENEERAEKIRQEESNKQLQKELNELENYQNKLRDNYKNSNWGTIAEMHKVLSENSSALNDWIWACKSNNKSGLESYLNKSYYLEYFNNVAKLMILGWEKGNTNPNDYIKIAIQEQNWPLVKYLLENGAKPSYEEMDPSNLNHTPVNDCMFSSRHRELSLKGTDVTKMIKQLVAAGAKVDGVFQIERNYQVKTIEMMLFYDYKGELFKWLVDNNKLGAEDQKVALKALCSYYGNRFQHYGQLYFDNYKEYFKLNADRTQIVPVIEGQPNAKDNVLLQIKYLLENKQTTDDVFKSFVEYALFTPPPANENCNQNTWVQIQQSLIYRGEETNKTDYLSHLAYALIAPYNSNYKVNTEDAKTLLAAIIKSGINPNQKVLRDGPNSFTSMLALAKNVNPALVDFLKEQSRETPSNTNKNSGSYSRGGF